MIRRCPLCQHEPSWHNAALSTRKEKAQRFILCGCTHLGELLNWAIVKPEERAAIETKILARWEVLFAEYTATKPWDAERCAAWQKANPGQPLPEAAAGLWNETNRAAYRARIWPPASGLPYESEEWVKDARARLRTLPGMAPEAFRHNVEPQEPEQPDCPFGE